MNRHQNGNTEDAMRSRHNTPKKPETHPDAEVKPPKNEDEVLGVIEGVEQQLTALRQAHAEHRKAMSELADRRRNIEQQAEELESREQELGAREIELAEMRQEFEQREHELVQRAQGLEQRESKIASQAESLEREEADIEAERQQIQARLKEIDGQLVALRDHAELEAREAEAAEKLAREEEAGVALEAVQKELKATEGKLRGREIELSERSRALEELAEQAGNLDAELTETKQKLGEALEKAQEHLHREQKVNDGLRAQLEKLADEGKAAQELHDKSELLRAQLAEANVELVELRRSSKESVESERGKIAELSEQIAGYQSEIAKLNEQLAASNDEIKRLRAELDSAHAQLSEAPSDEALEQANETIRELRAQLAEVGRIADEELTAERGKVAELDEQLGAVRAELEQVGAEREALKKELASKSGVDEAQLHELKARFQKNAAQLQKVTGQLEETADKYQKLRAEANEQRKAIEQSGVTIQKLEAQSTELISTIERLNEALETERARPSFEVDEWNCVRRDRLSRMRLVLKANAEKVRRATEALRDRYEQCEQVLVKRAELAEAYQAIAEAQAKNARRDVRSGTFLGMTGVGLLVLVLAGISWFVAGRIAPGEYAARVTLVANAGERQLEEGDLASWGVYMEELTEDPQFIEFAAERMKRRGFGDLGIPGELRQAMRASLDVASPTPGTIEMEYRGQGAERSQRVLDTFAVALSSAANNARARRSDGATTSIPEVAQAGSQPLDTRRVEMAGMVFGGSMLGSLMLGGLIYSRLSAAKARFERDSRVEPLFDDAQWHMPG